MTPTSRSIAVIGMACLYPDCRGLEELWQTVLAQRRAFRKIPDERLNARDYVSADRNAPDKTYLAHGAVIEGYEFDRVRYKIVGSTFRSADLAHWLALDVAAQALEDSGVDFDRDERLSRENCGVLLGNTLTGEFSRANVMRLRWPYVSRIVESKLESEGWPADKRRAFMADLEQTYKAPFPPVGEETLAGGLSNTIAGRVCNYFNFKGGGYTLDGACASSLLAIANACSMLSQGDLDFCLAGGVDLSLDPFELVGFAKTGALAPREMRIFDRDSAGFWPGEGCGMAALMREEDARQLGCRIYAVIRGWGISSDGEGGITRPEKEGQLLAIRRAYRKAGFDVDAVGYFEAHGTGTQVGDSTELNTLTEARRRAKAVTPPAAIGSIKANIGHTKSAAGIAGFIKASLTAHYQTIPPITGCENPHAIFEEEAGHLRIVRQAEEWAGERPLRCGVSSMGFGGINTHVVLESPGAGKGEGSLHARVKRISCAYQDAELFVFRGGTADLLIESVEKIHRYAARLSQGELTDLAAALIRDLPESESGARAAVVASTPLGLARKLESLLRCLKRKEFNKADVEQGIFIGEGSRPPKIGFLFPGQASPVRVEPGLFGRRWPWIADRYGSANLPGDYDAMDTQLAQPAIALASAVCVELLGRLGVEGDLGIGHSLGELSALHWAGVMDRDALVELAAARGAAMGDLDETDGGMAAVRASAEEVKKHLNGNGLRVTGYNSSRQTVIGGDRGTLESVCASFKRLGIDAKVLPVKHAFHTEAVSLAAVSFKDHLNAVPFEKPHRQIISTVTAAPVGRDEDLKDVLCRQILAPVRFTDAIKRAMKQDGAETSPDVWIETGPGNVLSGLLSMDHSTPAIAIDLGGPSLSGVLNACAAAFALGVRVNLELLFEDRYYRDFNLDWNPSFFSNPCEQAPVIEREGALLDPDARERQPNAMAELEEAEAAIAGAAVGLGGSASGDPIEILNRLLAQRTELPEESLQSDFRMLNDLHLNSIAVSKIVSQAAQEYGIATPLQLTDYANASIQEIAASFRELRESGGERSVEECRFPEGLQVWHRMYHTEWIPRPLPAPPLPRFSPPGNGGGSSTWKLLADDGHPLRKPLTERLSELPGPGGVLVCLPETADAPPVETLLEAARLFDVNPGHRYFVVVQDRVLAGGFAKSFQLERPQSTTVLLTLPMRREEAAQWILNETRAARGFTEARIDENNTRQVPRWRLLERHGFKSDASRSFPVGRQETLLVTGGGKGIAAECALHLARRHPIRLGLIGRSLPDADPELLANLARMEQAGIQTHYAVADVTQAGQVRAAIREIEAGMGPITGFLHSAGVNEPCRIEDLDEEIFRQTLAPKLNGFDHVIAALKPGRLKLLIAFGSIIGRMGLAGEAHYATANEWLTERAAAYGEQHPECRCLALEWSVWSGAGMGQRLGSVDVLMRQGIHPISVDEGVSILEGLAARDLPAVQWIVTGRFGDPPTVPSPNQELPLLRFLEEVKAHYPEVELVADSVISAPNDPYLVEHDLHGQLLFPAVVGMEAMAQAACSLAGRRDVSGLNQVRLKRPISVDSRDSCQIRLAALQVGDRNVKAAVKTEETDFKRNHFEAEFEFGAPESNAIAESLPPPPEGEVRLDIQRDLYEKLLFHTGRFRLVRRYLHLTAWECAAEIAPCQPSPWFGNFMPQELLLGDPAERDAALHAIQACIPHRRILPVGIRRIQLKPGESGAGRIKRVHALETSREGDQFLYDVEIRDASTGDVLEFWQGLQLKAVETLAVSDLWPPSLLGPYVERRLEELFPGDRIAVQWEEGTFRGGGAADRILQRVTGDPQATAAKRPDGRRELSASAPRASMVLEKEDAPSVSVSHASGLTCSVAGQGILSCDLMSLDELDRDRETSTLDPADERMANFLVKECGLKIREAAARVWAARESLKKAGAHANHPLVYEEALSDGWMILKSGGMKIACNKLRVQRQTHPVVLAVLKGEAMDEGF